jgi:hypothetical protein
MSHEVLHGVLIAVELGADWPPWLSELAGEPPRRVMTQAEGEPPQAFAERVVSEAKRERAPFRSAVLLCNERTDLVQHGARRLLARSVPAELDAIARGKLVLAASSQASEKLRSALRSLTRDLESKQNPPVARFGRSQARRSKQHSKKLIARVA